MNKFSTKYFVTWNQKTVPKLTTGVDPQIDQSKKGLFLNLYEPVYIQSPKMNVSEGIQLNLQFEQTLKAIEDQLKVNIVDNRLKIFKKPIEPEIVNTFFRYQRHFDLSVIAHLPSKDNIEFIFKLVKFQLKGQDIIPVWTIHKYRQELNIESFLGNIVETEGELESELEAENELDESGLETVVKQEKVNDVTLDQIVDAYKSTPDLETIVEELNNPETN